MAQGTPSKAGGHVPKPPVSACLALLSREQVQTHYIFSMSGRGNLGLCGPLCTMRKLRPGELRCFQMTSPGSSKRLWAVHVCSDKLTNRLRAGAEGMWSLSTAVGRVGVRAEVRLS